MSLTPVAERRYAIILAGGSGTRLWPLSRSRKPKQLLTLEGEESLLQQTAKRLLPLVGASKVYVVTQESYRFEVMGQLHAVTQGLADNVLAEPFGRNTLPAIAWAVARIARQTPDALVGVFSSDHAIADSEAFHQGWLTAELPADGGDITLFGIRPQTPATGFGYIQGGEPLELDGAPYPAQRVSRFVEKPDEAAARRYVAEGDYYWNAGMFVFRADHFMKTLAEGQPEIHRASLRLAESNSPVAAAEVYATMPDLSIDYGLLENTTRAAVVPLDMGWSDLGSWEAVYQHRQKDKQGNMVEGEVIALDSHDNLLWSDHGLVATLGVDGIAVVQTRDATLVCPRQRMDDLKQLVAEVKKTHRHLTETHVTTIRPWGSYTVLEEGPRYKIKRIVVNPLAKLSTQMHHHRSEHWVVISGTAKITNGEQEIYLEENQSTYIPKKHRHRLENPGKIPLQIIEIQSGDYLEEDDIIRFGDIYGRPSDEAPFQI